MFSTRFIRLTRLDRLPRQDGTADRVVALSFTARFTDELLSNAWDVLTPTFRRVFGLSLVQVGLLDQVLTWVGLAVEPVAASLADVRSRRRLMAVGAAAVAVSVLLMAAAPTYAVLLVGFALYGVGSGPLAHTADIVVVETFPTTPERAYSRATFLDTVGALLGPLSIAVAGAAGLSWRWVLAALGVGTLGYAWAIRGTPFPERARPRPAALARQLVTNAATVVRHRRARRLLLLLFWFDLFETAFLLEYVWLHDTVGLSEPMVAAYAAAQQLVDLVALVLLDRWLSAHSPRRILQAAAAVLIVLPAAWVAVPSLTGKIVVGVPLSFAYALVWPLAKSQSLTALPELSGSTQAISTLFAIVPLALIESRLAEAVGIGAAMAGTAAVAAALMWLTVCAAEPAVEDVEDVEDVPC